jgi:hypothetical protein
MINNENLEIYPVLRRPQLNLNYVRALINRNYGIGIFTHPDTDQYMTNNTDTSKNCQLDGVYRVNYTS